MYNFCLSNNCINKVYAKLNYKPLIIITNKIKLYCPNTTFLLRKNYVFSILLLF